METTVIKQDPSALVASLMCASLEPRKVGEATFLILPPNYQKIEVTDAVEKANAVPNRKSGIARLGSVPSLLQYLADQNAVGSAYVYADVDSRTTSAVFNDQRGLFSGWRDHRATYEAELTPEFKLWMARNKQKFSQTEFAEFIEDNFADLAGDDAGTLLNVATTIAATTGINFASAKRLDNGQTQLTYNETIDAKAGADGSLKIPQKFTLGMRIFKNGEAYSLTARLKYRMGGGAVNFFYELERPERSIDDAFNGYVEEVRTKSGYTVLIGKP